MKITNKNRLIKRMIIALGTAVTIASVGATAYGFVEATNVRNYYKNQLDTLNEQKVELQNDKDTYLDEFESSTTFKDIYNSDVEDINNRLIAREITGVEYDTQLAYLDSNKYIEEALLSSSEPIKNEVEQINAEISEVNTQINALTDEREAKSDKLTSWLTISGTAALTTPFITFMAYGLYNAHSKEEKIPPLAKIRISEPIPNTNHVPIYDENTGVIKILEEIPAGAYYNTATESYIIPKANTRDTSIIETEYYYDSTTGKLRPLSSYSKRAEKIKNKPRHVDACIINTEEDEQNNTL